MVILCLVSEQKPKAMLRLPDILSIVHIRKAIIGLDYNKDNSGDTFAGTCKSEIDGLQFCIDGVKGRHVKYRVHTKEDGWLAWVTDYGDGPNGFAGVYGHAIDAVQIEII